MTRRDTIIIGAMVASVAAIASHWLLVAQVPRIAMAKVTERIVDAPGSGYNILRQAPPVTPAARRVVRPSPDLVYSICVYDVSKGPVRLRMAFGPGYHSLSLYDANTNNFFVVNDQEASEEPVLITLTDVHGNIGNAHGSVESGTYIAAPTNTGVALIRRQATPASMLKSSLETRKGDRCESVS